MPPVEYTQQELYAYNDYRRRWYTLRTPEMLDWMRMMWNDYYDTLVEMLYDDDLFEWRRIMNLNSLEWVDFLIGRDMIPEGLGEPLDKEDFIDRYRGRLENKEDDEDIIEEEKDGYIGGAVSRPMIDYNNYLENWINVFTPSAIQWMNYISNNHSNFLDANLNDNERIQWIDISLVNPNGWYPFLMRLNLLETLYSNMNIEPPLTFEEFIEDYNDPDIQGGGIYDVFKKGVNYAKGLAKRNIFRAKAVGRLLKGRKGTEPTGRFKDFLDKEGDKEIDSIQVGRFPLSKGVNVAMNILSGGKVAKTQKELDYDELYHQYMVVKYKDGTKRTIQKNAVIEAWEPTKKELDGLVVDIPVNKKLTVKQMMDTASYNDDTFWAYDAGKNNCQITVKNILQRNELLDGIDTGKIVSNPESQKIVDSIPKPLNKIPLVVTNLASSLDALYYGRGKGKKVIVKDKAVVNPEIYAKLIVDGVI